MEAAKAQQTLVIGVGNPWRGDDAAGLRVAALLQAHADEAFVVVEQSGEGAALMEAWQDAARVILIDAVRSGAEPGTIHRLDAVTQTIPRQLGSVPGLTKKSSWSPSAPSTRAKRP